MTGNQAYFLEEP